MSGGDVDPLLKARDQEVAYLQAVVASIERRLGLASAVIDAARPWASDDAGLADALEVYDTNRSAPGGAERAMVTPPVEGEAEAADDARG